MSRKRDRRHANKRRRSGPGGGRRRSVPHGLGLALGLIAALMLLAFAAMKMRDCRSDPVGQGG